MTQDEFYDLLTMIGKGEATPDELKDGLAYCAGTSMETGMMFRALVNGYGALTAAVERKDRKLRAAWEFAQRGKNMADEVIGHYDERKEGKHGQNKAN